MTFVLATRNKKKMEEISRMFSDCNIRFLTLDSFPGCPDVTEDGATFRANAVKKAVHAAACTGCPAIADDSGLEVMALGGAPGVFSARYAGEETNDVRNMKKLLKEMKPLKEEQRDARFVCCIALALPDGKVKTFTGYVKGRIGRSPRGSNGFGYDPLFYPAGRRDTFAEMAASEKDMLSHRGNALRKLHRYLRSIS